MKPWFAFPLAALLVHAALAADDRFAQPVRVADLIGQKLVAPRESQTLLGHVEAVERNADALSVRIKTATLLPWTGRSIAVPLAEISFLGPQLALTGLTEAELAALPDTQASAPVAADERIRIVPVKPFH